ncbi:MAG: carboxypeptidase-like regulatory domain-containing protein [Acidobacteria bacterium]|nr:carboxypeptidase-like regulatory domain-containing protein [Acidobacteriota bacterium]
MIAARIVVLFLLPLFGLANTQQSDAISGRVVSDGGNALAGVSVYLTPVGGTRSGSPRRTTSDGEGNFTFSGLTQNSYLIRALNSQGYIPKPITASEAGNRGIFRPGENVTLTMIKGGVITGRVVSPEGDPVIGVEVRAVMVRDQNGRATRAVVSGGQRYTNDLGIYRIYGLMPGSYIVAANPSESPTRQSSLYNGEIAVYHPSSTRESADEVAVDSGSELTGIDIRYRGEFGHTISGTISGLVDSGSSYYTSVILYYAAGSVHVGSTSVTPGSTRFQFHGLHDGEFILIARRVGPEEIGAVSPARRVSIKGADVTGINLPLSPLATVDGKIILEKAAAPLENNCAGSLERAIVILRRDEIAGDEGETSLQPFGSSAMITDEGLFSVRNLEPGRNRVEMRVHQQLYVKSIILPTTRTARRAVLTVDISRSGLSLRSGDRVKGLAVTLVEGAAQLSGKIIAEEGSSLPPRMRVYLVPAELVAVDDLLRYFEIQASPQYTFSIGSIAPGKYWMLSRPIADETINIPVKPAAWDNIERARLRKEAESRMNEIELKPCQRLGDQVLKY